MSQPFTVAQVFTDREGKYVSIKDTVASFKGVLEGKADTLPEQAFFLVGTLDDVRENAAKLEGGVISASASAARPVGRFHFVGGFARLGDGIAPAPGCAGWFLPPAGSRSLAGATLALMEWESCQRPRRRQDGRRS